MDKRTEAKLMTFWIGIAVIMVIIVVLLLTGCKTTLYAGPGIQQGLNDRERWAGSVGIRGKATDYLGAKCEHVSILNKSDLGMNYCGVYVELEI